MQHDVDELVLEVEQVLEFAKNKNDISKPKVKNILENLRSALEYMAQDINQKLNFPVDRIYFPYGSNKSNFDNSINKNLRKLKEEFPRIYELVEGLQPHICHDDWLYVMCNLTNHVKHKAAINLKKKERFKSIKIDLGCGISIQGGQNSRINSGTIYVNGKKLDSFHFENEVMTVTEKGEVQVDFSIEGENRIIIDDHDYDLFDFLEKALKNIKEFSSLLYKELV